MAPMRKSAAQIETKKSQELNMQPEAYWLFPNGKIQPVGTTHIQAVKNCPEEYGETLGSLKNLYYVYEERMPHEGNARVEIMKRVMKRGYIRIRERRNHWVIQLYKLSPKEHKFISQWVNCVWDNLIDKYADIKVNTLQNNRLTIIPFSEFK